MTRFKGFGGPHILSWAKALSSIHKVIETDMSYVLEKGLEKLADLVQEWNGEAGADFEKYDRWGEMVEVQWWIGGEHRDVEFGDFGLPGRSAGTLETMEMNMIRKIKLGFEKRRQEAEARETFKKLPFA